jgi:NAD+ synthase (glutamine-hydrolysing)
MMKIACYPFAAGADMEENLLHIRLGVKTAAEHRARLVCFQECALTGYPPVETAIESVTEEKCAAGLQAVSALAREWGICILIGTVL